MAILIAISITACTTDITIDLDKATPELVVEATITTDTLAHSVRLTKTGNYFSNKSAEPISGAVVTLNDGKNTITLLENASRKGIYQTPPSYFGIVGRTYTLLINNLDVNADGVKETYSATSSIGSTIHIDSTDVVKNRLFQRDMWAIKVWVQDPIGESNYYVIRNHRNDKCTSDSIQEWQITNDEFFDGIYMKNETFNYFSSQKEDEKLQVGDKIALELCSVSKEYMEFVQQSQEEFWGRNPLFGGQPANIRTNIKQIIPANNKTSAHGFFATYSATWGRTVYSGK